TLPKDEKAVLSIFDVNGKILKVWNQVFKEGLNTIEITKSELVQSGILYYSLETGGNKSVRKMILID
ncbi:MAG: T9SS type A sorting domain-containing protein, partial [Saprospiraceae bacterium]